MKSPIKGKTSLYTLDPADVFGLKKGVNTPPAESRWLQVTAKSRIGPPFGGLRPQPTLLKAASKQTPQSTVANIRRPYDMAICKSQTLCCRGRNSTLQSDPEPL